jgi:hypothetical protein
MDGGRRGGRSPCRNRKPRPSPPQWHDPRQSQPNPEAPARKTEELPTPRPKILATGRSEMGGRRITPTDAASRHHGSLVPSPCVGGAVSPVILAATAGPPRSSSATAAGQWGCCPESAPAPDPQHPAARLPRAAGPPAGAPRSPRNPRQPRQRRHHRR